jgi:hypothetical protein
MEKKNAPQRGAIAGLHFTYQLFTVDFLTDGRAKECVGG